MKAGWAKGDSEGCGIVPQAHRGVRRARQQRAEALRIPTGNVANRDFGGLYARVSRWKKSLATAP